ncbi:MAG: putative DsbA family dithiol-disulfide isomerase [Gammaproteobacteria bacterium]|jgi:predicted DsbA family dithiol-disulfide isomerase
MTTTIKLDFISDVVCPWCIIGFKRLQQAINELGIQDQITIEWQPFELNPDMPAEGENLPEHISRKYGSTAEDAKRNADQITGLGAAMGFKFDFFDGMRIVNTRNVHILLDFAKDHGKQTELKMRLFDAYFNERKDISDRHILIQEIQSVGLNTDEALAILDNTAVREQIEAEEEHWRNRGVTAVPTVVFGSARALVGAQPVDVYKQALTELLATEFPENPATSQ